MRKSVKREKKSGNAELDKAEMAEVAINPDQEENKEENHQQKPERRRIAKKKPYSPGSSSELKSNIHQILNS